jgi:hypothetical protein
LIRSEFFRSGTGRGRFPFGRNEMKGMRQLHGAWRYLPYLDLFFAVLITLLFLIFNHILHSSGTSLGEPI